MNIYQRIVLVLGAIALIVTIWTAPNLVVVKGIVVNADALPARAIAVLGTTALLFFALKGLKSPASFRILPRFLKSVRFWKWVFLFIVTLSLLGASFFILQAIQERGLVRSPGPVNGDRIPIPGRK